VLEKLWKDAGVGKLLQNASCLGKSHPGFGPVATPGQHLRERQQPDQGGPGAQTGQPSSREKAALQLLLGLF
jgi:hypothetical protein